MYKKYSLAFLLAFLMLVVVSCQKGGEPTPLLNTTSNHNNLSQQGDRGPGGDNINPVNINPVNTDPIGSGGTIVDGDDDDDDDNQEGDGTPTI